MAVEVIRRMLEKARRRNRVRRAVVDLVNHGGCAHVVPGEVDSETVLIHTCGDRCPWLAARTIVTEHLGAW